MVRAVRTDASNRSVAEAPPEAVRVLASALNSQQLGAAMFEHLVREVVAYRSVLNTPMEVEIRAHVDRHAQATLACLRSHRTPCRQELIFVTETGVQRARQGVALVDLLHAYRAGYTAVWAYVQQEAKRMGVEASATLVLGGLAMDYFNAISSTVTEAYVREEHLLRAAQARQRGALVNACIAGDLGRARSGLATWGLDRPHPIAVLCAVAGDPGEAALEALRVELVAALDSVLQGPALSSVRQARVVVLLAQGEPDGARFSALVQEAWGAVQPVGKEELTSPPGLSAGLSAGLSTVWPGLVDVGTAYAEAERALALAGQGQLCQLARCRLFEDLLGQADRTTLRLLPAWARSLWEEDKRGRGELAQTLETYLKQELSVTRTGKLLGIHPNTVRYRLSRIEALTDSSIRVFDDLVEIVIALRLLRACA